MMELRSNSMQRFQAKELNTCYLPTAEDMMMHYIFLENKEKERLNGKEPSSKDIVKAVAEILKLRWQITNIPILSHQHIINKISSYNNSYRQLLKYPKKRRHLIKERVGDFFNESKKLFDISACKCDTFEICHCPEKSKVPASAKNFLLNQRSSRTIHVKTYLKSLESTFKILSQSVSELSSNVSEAVDFISPVLDRQLSIEEKEISQENCSGNNQMRIALPNLASACIRTGTSVTSAAIIANSVLTDVGIITADDKSSVIDKNKLRREIQKIYKDLHNNIELEDMKCLFFDGRKDLTLIQEKQGAKYYKKQKMEEHVVMLQEPGSKYLGHLSLENGTAVVLSSKIIEFLEYNEIHLSDLKTVGCDGTPVNTGVHGGVIKLLETNAAKPLQWLICQLHGNELLLRHLFIHVDGRQVGPNSHVGPISKFLKNCETLPVVEFQAVGPSELPKYENFNELSTDQRYLYLISKAVIEGRCSVDLSLMNPGNISHSRWLTTANRILRLYVATEKPAKKLVQLVTLIIKVYAPMWFFIKQKPLCFEGAKHCFNTISLSRCLDAEILKVIDPVIQRNAYFAHPENLLLAMAVDDRINVRSDALNKIFICRENQSENLRSFKVPAINFDAQDYTDLIRFDSFTEPPLLHDISNEHLATLILNNPEELKQQLRLPCHTQAVERHVKMVTEASKSVFGPEQRDGYIRTMIKSRNTMPSFVSKQDFAFDKESASN